MNTSRRCDQFEDVVAAACRLIASGSDVKAIQLETSRRPNYDELLRYRIHAEVNGLAMTLLGHNRVMLRARASKLSLCFRRGHRIDIPDGHTNL